MTTEYDPPSRDRPSGEANPSERPLPGYTPQQIRWLLSHYPALALGVRPPRDPRVPPPRGRLYARDPEKWPVEVKADIDRALVWLLQIDHDPPAAHALWSLYCDPALRREPSTIAEHIVADDLGVTARTIRNWRVRGIGMMAAFLSGSVIDDDEDLRPFPKPDTI